MMMITVVGKYRTAKHLLCNHLLIKMAQSQKQPVDVQQFPGAEIIQDSSVNKHLISILN
jgi:hypothetical protein